MTYILRALQQARMAKYGTQTQRGVESPVSSSTASSQQSENREYSTQLTMADLEDSLSPMYNRLAEKFQSELHKTTSTLTQEITALVTHTDPLETKHDELAFAHTDLRKDFASLAESYSFMQTQIEELYNRRNNLQLRGILESVTDLVSDTSRLFHSLLPDAPTKAFACDRVHRALCLKPPVEKPPT